jgi:hypothetical protein
VEVIDESEDGELCSLGTADAWLRKYQHDEPGDRARLERSDTLGDTGRRGHAFPDHDYDAELEHTGELESAGRDATELDATELDATAVGDAARDAAGCDATRRDATRSHHPEVGDERVRLAHQVAWRSNLAKDNPEAGVIAPENKGVGMPLAAIDNSLHYFNFTDKPIIKEAWVNFWYRDKSEVTTPTIEMFSILGMGIDPGQHVLKHGSCDITEAGRLLTVYGHVHAHNKRFSVWRTRGGNKTLIHEAYDWTTPNVSEFSSTVMNPMLDPTHQKDGGYSGIMDLAAGDTLDFECDIVNDTQNTFIGQNEAMNDEMCIMIGDTVGTTVPIACTGTDIPAN